VTTTDPTTSTTIVTTPAPATPLPPVQETPAKVAHPQAAVSIAGLDARLVVALGLSKAASEFASGARAAGLRVPGRFGTEAVARLGMPYIWGGTSDSYEAPFGVPSRGGYDCSGFVWRVYKLQPYGGERSLASMLRGRTTYQMSGEVPHYDLVNFKHLQPADV